MGKILDSEVSWGGFLYISWRGYRKSDCRDVEVKFLHFEALWEVIVLFYCGLWRCSCTLGCRGEVLTPWGVVSWYRRVSLRASCTLDTREDILVIWGVVGRFCALLCPG